MKDQLNEKRITGNDQIKVTIVQPDTRMARVDLYPMQGGVYKVSWTPVVSV